VVLPTEVPVHRLRHHRTARLSRKAMHGRPRAEAATSR